MGSIEVELKKQPLLATLCDKDGQLYMEIYIKLILELQALPCNTKRAIH
jgi:hypothetical protein